MTPRLRAPAFKPGGDVGVTGGTTGMKTCKPDVPGVWVSLAANVGARLYVFLLTLFANVRTVRPYFEEDVFSRTRFVLLCRMVPWELKEDAIRGMCAPPRH